MEGKADYRPSPGYENKMHLIGTTASPVWIGRKGDVPRLFTNQFWIYYDFWKKFNLGLGLPESGTWVDNDQDVVDAIVLFEEHYRAHFSPQRAMMQIYANAIAARR